MTGRSAGPTLGDLASLVQRLAVLLGAGLAPLAAWRHAARAPFEAVGALIAEAGPSGIPAAIAGGSPAGASLTGDSLARASPAGSSLALRSAWAGFAATWAVATAAGASLAPTLRGYADLLRGFAAAQREITIALAGPRATSRLVLVLPLVAIAFGVLIGQDTLGVLVGTPLGWGCLVVGAVLMLAGWGWSRRLLRGAAARDPTPGLVEELTAVAMRGGVSVDRARELVDRELARFGIVADRTAADEALALAAASGAPAGDLLRAEAEERRRSAVAAARARAERLAVVLMLPLGVCVLPAFVAVGVVPMMAAVIGSTLTAV